MASSTSPQRARFLWSAASVGLVLAVVALIWLSYRAIGTPRAQYDDAYITYRYAIQLARGHGLVFDIGERTDAASSFSYALLLSGLYRLGGHDLELAGALFGLASAGGIAWAVQRGVLASTGRPLVALAMGAAAGTHGFVSGWSLTGMETTFFAFLVTAFVAAYFFARSASPALVPLLCVIVLTRVEGGLLAVAWLVDEATRALRGDVARARVARRAGAVLATGAAFVAFKWVYYRSLLPHPFHLKRIVMWHQPRPDYLADLWRQHALAVVLLAAVGLYRWSKAERRAGLAVYLAASAVSVLWGPASDWGRYSAHLLPTMALCAGVALAALVPRWRLMAAALTVAIAFQTEQSFVAMRDTMASFAEHQRCRKQLGDYIAARLHPSRPVLSSDLGAIAYRAIDASFVDAVGLTSLDIMQRYLAGQSVDDILDAKAPAFVADTYVPPHHGPGRYAALSRLVKPGSLLTKPVPPSQYADRAGFPDPLFLCQSSDGRAFAVGALPP